MFDGTMGLWQGVRSDRGEGIPLSVIPLKLAFPSYPQTPFIHPRPQRASDGRLKDLTRGTRDRGRRGGLRGAPTRPSLTSPGTTAAEKGGGRTETGRRIPLSAIGKANKGIVPTLLLGRLSAGGSDVAPFLG